MSRCDESEPSRYLAEDDARKQQILREIDQLIDTSSTLMSQRYQPVAQDRMAVYLLHEMTRLGLIFEQAFPDHDVCVSYHALIGSTPLKGVTTLDDFPDGKGVRDMLRHVITQLQEGKMHVAPDLPEDMTSVRSADLIKVARRDLEPVKEWVREKLGLDIVVTSNKS